MLILYQFNRPNWLNPRHATFHMKPKGLGSMQKEIFLKLRSMLKEMAVQIFTAINLMIDIALLASTRFQSMICRRKMECLTISKEDTKSKSMRMEKKSIFRLGKMSCSTYILDQRFHSSLNASLQTQDKS